MIVMTLGRQIADVVGGQVHGDGDDAGHRARRRSTRAPSSPVACSRRWPASTSTGTTSPRRPSRTVPRRSSPRRPVDAPCVVVDDVTAALGRLATHVLGRSIRSSSRSPGRRARPASRTCSPHVLEPSGTTVAPAGSFNNELGVPLTVLRADQETQYLVVEMGARGVGHIASLCRIAPPDVGWCSTSAMPTSASSARPTSPPRRRARSSRRSRPTAPRCSTPTTPRSPPWRRARRRGSSRSASRRRRRPGRRAARRRRRAASSR